MSLEIKKKAENLLVLPNARFSFFLTLLSLISLDFFEKFIEKSDNLKWNTMNFIEITSSKNFQLIYNPISLVILRFEFVYSLWGHMLFSCL